VKGNTLALFHQEKWSGGYTTANTKTYLRDNYKTFLL